MQNSTTDSATARFAGKCAIVTGASSGIGRAAALQLAREGAQVAFSYHSRREAAENLASQIAEAGGRAFAFPLNLGDSSALNGQFDKAINKLGSLDILINNAGEWMKNAR